ncbi:MAG TPA: hypothetical protein PKC21_04880 [Oligoflexia bacterium]|nr:hypothetical protein [Oligoflexia bacterium]HMR24672.1 hypothetical protein [Oligoflexia bacterium]
MKEEKVAIDTLKKFVYLASMEMRKKNIFNFIILTLIFMISGKALSQSISESIQSCDALAKKMVDTETNFFTFKNIVFYTAEADKFSYSITKHKEYANTKETKITEYKNNVFATVTWKDNSESGLRCNINSQDCTVHHQLDTIPNITSFYIVDEDPQQLSCHCLVRTFFGEKKVSLKNILVAIKQDLAGDDIYSEYDREDDYFQVSCNDFEYGHK